MAAACVRVFCRADWSLHKRLQGEYLASLSEAEAAKVKGCIAPWVDYVALGRCIVVAS